MIDEKRTTEIEPNSLEADMQIDEDDTQGHSLLSGQLGGVMANERAREAARWAAGEKARKQNKERGKDGHR